MSYDPKRTQVAQNAFDFSRYFASTFGHARVRGTVNRRPEVIAPEGMSTQGGKAARQPIVLQDETGVAPTVTVGWVDFGQRKAGLRTHQALLLLHRARFGARPLDIEEGSYAGFINQTEIVLSACGFTVAREDVDAPSTPSSAEARPPTEWQGPWLFAAVAFSAFGIGAVAGGLLVYARFVGF